jgi:hypothetical protein
LDRTKRIGRIGRLAACVVAAAPFAFLWVQMVRAADEPPTAQVGLELAIWMAVFATPWMIAAWLLWRAGWRQAGARLSSLDGPGRLLAVATATLPADRRDWGEAMAAELTQVRDPAARWRFAAGCARTAVFPPGGSRVAVAAAAVLAAVAVAVVALGTGAVLPAGRVFALAFVGLLGVLATLAVARSRGTGGSGQAGWTGPGPAGAGRGGPGAAVAGLALAGVVACLAATTYYLAEHPSYPQRRSLAMVASLAPATAVALAVALAGCLWLAVRPPRWLVPDRHGRRFGVAMAVVLVAGFVVASRLGLRGVDGPDEGIATYLFFFPILVVLTGSMAAAAAGRSFRAGLWACAWGVALAAPPIIAAWLAEALAWYRQGRGMLLDADGALGVGVNLGDAVWWTLALLALWVLPFGVIGAAAGSVGARRRRAAG